MRYLYWGPPQPCSIFWALQAHLDLAVNGFTQSFGAPKLVPNVNLASSGQKAMPLYATPANNAGKDKATRSRSAERQAHLQVNPGN